MQIQKLPTFFSKNISVYAMFNDQSFNDTLTNDVVSFEQLGPERLIWNNSNLRQKGLKCKEHITNWKKNISLHLFWLNK